MNKKIIIFLITAIFLVPCIVSAGEGEQQQKRALTQEDVAQINELEKNWAKQLDAAGPLMAKQQYLEAAEYIKQSLSDTSNIIGIAKARGATDAEILKMNRIMGMLRLSKAYLNLTELMPIGDNPVQLTRGNVDKYKSLLENTFALLSDAKQRFSDAPYIENLCAQLLNELEKIRKFL